MLCRPKESNGERSSSSIVAACGIYMKDILEAAPVDKYFELYKPGASAVPGPIAPQRAQHACSDLGAVPLARLSRQLSDASASISTQAAGRRAASSAWPSRSWSLTKCGTAPWPAAAFQQAVSNRRRRGASLLAVAACRRCWFLPACDTTTQACGDLIPLAPCPSSCSSVLGLLVKVGVSAAVAAAAYAVLSKQGVLKQKQEPVPVKGKKK